MTLKVKVKYVHDVEEKYMYMINIYYTGDPNPLLGYLITYLFFNRMMMMYVSD